MSELENVKFESTRAQNRGSLRPMPVASPCTSSAAWMLAIERRRLMCACACAATPAAPYRSRRHARIASQHHAIPQAIPPQ